MGNHQIERCILCDFNISPIQVPNDNEYGYDCPICKKVRAHSNLNLTAVYSDPLRYVVSGYLRNLQDVSSKPTRLLTHESYDEIKKIAVYPKSIDERIEQAILYTGSVTRLGQTSINTDHFRTAWYCEDQDAFYFIRNYLLKSGLVSDQGGFVLTIEGWRLFERIRSKRISDKGFIAIRIGSESSRVRLEWIKEAFNETKYTPFPIIDKEHNNSIPEEILAEIKLCRFMIADLTELRPNVIYEAGYATGLGKDIIFICRQDHMDSVKASCFDINHINIIVFDSENRSELVSRIRRRIQLTIN